MARPEKIRLGDMLVQQNLVTGEQLKLALEEQKRSGRKLGRVLVESGYVTEEGISTGLARQLGADCLHRGSVLRLFAMADLPATILDAQMVSGFAG